MGEETRAEGQAERSEGQLRVGHVTFDLRLPPDARTALERVKANLDALEQLRAKERAAASLGFFGVAPASSWYTRPPSPPVPPLAPTLDDLAEGLAYICNDDDEEQAEELLQNLDTFAPLAPAAVIAEVRQALAAFQTALGLLDAARERVIATRNAGIVAERITAEWRPTSAHEGAITTPMIDARSITSGFGTRIVLSSAGMYLEEMRLDGTIVTHPFPSPSELPAPPPSREAQALDAAIRERVEAAIGAGRRVNVLEVGIVEADLLGRPATYSLAMEERGVGLVVRAVDQESALSVYYDPEV